MKTCCRLAGRGDLLQTGYLLQVAWQGRLDHEQGFFFIFLFFFFYIQLDLLHPEYKVVLRISPE